MRLQVRIDRPDNPAEWTHLDFPIPEGFDPPKALDQLTILFVDDEAYGREKVIAWSRSTVKE